MKVMKINGYMIMYGDFIVKRRQSFCCRMFQRENHRYYDYDAFHFEKRFPSKENDLMQRRYLIPLTLAQENEPVTSCIT